MLFSNLMVLVDFKGYFQGQKGPIWTFVIYLGQYLRNGAYCDQCLYEAHIQSHSHIQTFKVESRSHDFKRLYSEFWPNRISRGQRLDRTPVYTGSAKGSWDRCKLLTAFKYNFNHIYMLFGN